jgi:PiT family inorganic phosphate transporter
MPEASLGLFVLVLIFAITFGFTNGLNDAANAIATVIGSRVLAPRYAIAMAAVMNFAGAATGTAVARTIGKGIIAPAALDQLTLVAALASITLWGLLATAKGLPISLTHGLISGLVGAGLATSGAGVVHWPVLGRVLSAVVIAPLLGFAGGFVLMVVVSWLFRGTAPSKVRGIFSNLQILSAGFMAYSHGKNDGQMPIGVIALALVVYTGSQAYLDSIPWWVIVVSAGAITTGTAVGGMRVIRTIGMRMTALRPVHGFSASAAAASVIEAASHLGIPVSTTHSSASAVMGVGATRRFSAVRWGVAGEIVASWLLTFPACGVLGWLLAWIFKAAF